MHFKDKVVWITGASSGIGKELALQLAKKDAVLILTARDSASLNLVKKEVSSISGKVCHVVPFDLLDNQNLGRLVTEAFTCEGKIDCAIMNAGVSQRSIVEETELEVYRHLMEINYFAPVTIIKELLPIFDKQKIGNITVISSVAGLFGFPLRSGYSAAKHAITGFIETMQCELYKSTTKITAIYPGRIDTEISKNALDGNGNRLGLPDQNNTLGMSVSECVARIIRAIEKEKKTIIIAKSEFFLYKIWWYWRSLFYKIAYTKGMKHQ